MKTQLHTLNESPEPSEIDRSGHTGCGAADGVDMLMKVAAAEGELREALDDGLRAVGLVEGVGGCVAGEAYGDACGAVLEGAQEFIATAVELGFPVQYLVGEHREVAVVVNHREGTVLDRAACVEYLGAGRDVFSVDAWAGPIAAKVAVDAAQAYARSLGIDGRAVLPEQGRSGAYSMATAAVDRFAMAAVFVLCGEGMPVVVVR